MSINSESDLAREVIEWQQANDRHVIERDEARAQLDQLRKVVGV